jgi:general secretion pathway protein A
MYTRFFGLNRLPFEASPDPGFLFDGPAHREAIASIEYAVATRMGFIMLTGEVGLGKTTVIRAFLDRYDRNRLLPIYVFHPLLSFDDLLELVCDELGLTLDPGIGSFNRLRAIQRELIRLYGDRRQVILVIDEAQRLPEETLENLRLLTNLETNDAKLLQIVLVGQPELEAVLAQPHLRQLEQRIALKARLDSLTPDDSVRYLRHRLTLAGADDPEDVISAPALRSIVDLARGVPRRMNILANRTLIDAFAADEKPVSATRVKRVAAGKGSQTPKISRRSVTAAVGIFAVLAIAAGIMLWPPGFASSERGAPAEVRTLARGSGETLALADRAPEIVAPEKLDEPQTVSPPTPPPPSETTGDAQIGVMVAPVALPVPAATPSGAEPNPRPPAPAELPPAPVPAAAGSPAGGHASPPPEAATPKETAPVGPPVELAGAVTSDTLYLVVPGDTLWKICLKVYGSDVAPSMISKVMSRNKIVSDVKLFYGKTIILPSPKNI